MQKYAIYTTETFDKLFRSLDRSEQNWIVKIKEKLEDNPVGKILRYSWLREKRYLSRNKRLYYLVDEDLKKILLISFAPKKDQSRIIEFIAQNMSELLEHLRSL